LISIVGWDIGGANVKAAWLACEGNQTQAVRVAARPFEIWRDKDRLPQVLEQVLAELDPGSPPQAMAVTMTAELADIFTTKREGVLFVLDSLFTSFPDCPSYALSLEGDFVLLAQAKERPLDFAAANWLATAKWIASLNRDCLVIDVGSTTTDILPILAGTVCTSGKTDLDRLISGELVYSGALRTNLAAIVQSVPVKGSICRVASEYFSISADVHLTLGHISPQEYACPTPDGRPPTIITAQQRLARLVCADTEQLSPDEINKIAAYIYDQQIQQISDAVLQVLSRLPRHDGLPIIALGSGKFLAVEAGRRLGMDLQELTSIAESQVSAVAPCLAAAYLLAGQLEAEQ
jgi:(4-(4-[2-(gamma-L-glutamylamino)ethyl]phenoxymethyl)furan-2-yl)methanamine synthase